jgi:glutathione synthase/RimK-type ligase-like ATP-grasp enzyme
MKAGSYFPGEHYSSLYAMAGDDCSLFFDLEDLTEKQQADHLSNIELTAMLQVALACVGHCRDHLALYDEYQKPGWQEMLRRYHDFFCRMTKEVVPMDHFSYHPKDTYYQSVANYIKDNPALTDVANLYMSSGSNKMIHQNEDLLTINRNVNSKKHFAENAPAFGIQVPDTLVTTKAELASTSVADFFSKHQNKIILKLLGLAGARNVTAVESITATKEYVAEYDEDMVILLQERLDLERYTEMTVDLVVSTDDIRIANIRKILFADGLWVGNLIGDSVSVTEEQVKALLHVGEYARHHGYVTDEGSNCGIDFFIGEDGSLIVTEINARWTGGLFPAQVLSQIDVQGRDAVPFFDMVLLEEREAYVDFIERHLVGEYEGEYAMVPIGFGCFPVPIDGQDYFYSWQMVVGDFDAFKRAKNEELAASVMITADIIQPYQ